MFILCPGNPLSECELVGQKYAFCLHSFTAFKVQQGGFHLYVHTVVNVMLRGLSVKRYVRKVWRDHEECGTELRKGQAQEKMHGNISSACVLPPCPTSWDFSLGLFL